jgi:ATP-dependent Zn protease
MSILASGRSSFNIIFRASERSSDASRASFVEHCYQEALAIIEENKPVVLALAQALIDHPERTLNSKEIDAVIAKTLGT